MAHTDIEQTPWFVVPSHDKRAARLNCITHLLSSFDDEDLTLPPVELPTMQELAYERPSMHHQTLVRQVY